MDRKEGKRLFIYGTCTKDENEELLKIDAYQSPVHHSRRNMTRLQLSMRTDLKNCVLLGSLLHATKLLELPIILPF